MDPPPISAAGRARARTADVSRLADEPWDLLIVGGGIVGCGALLDAATRGLRVALVEQDDIASGTSGRSSRLIHGGLRYLQQFRVGLVREALAERARLIRLAPHLVRLEGFLFPLYGPPLLTRGFYTAGMTFYDLLGSARSGGRHRHLGVAGTLEYAPGLRREQLRGAILYHDAMEDDARYTLAVLRTALAQAQGAALAVTSVRATGPVIEGGRIAGATLRDAVSGADLVVRARRVLDATGVWNAQPDRAFGTGGFNVLPSRGSHILIPRERIPVRGGMTIRIPGRVAFMVPWPRHWVIGTTDKPYHGPVARPSASGDDVDELLGTLNGAFDLDLTRDDIVGTYAGLRPLVAPSDADATVKISREHRVSEDADGLVRVSGGKYTTYRVMARDAVDAVLGAEAVRRPSGTAELPIIGAAARADLDALTGTLARELGADAAASLVGRHGTEAGAVVARGTEAGTNRPLADGFPYLESEVAWAVEEELARSLDDILARRIRLAPELRDRGAAIAPRVAEIAGGLLGWDEARRAAEVQAYLDGAHREYDLPAAG